MSINLSLLLIVAFVVSFSSLSFVFAVDYPTNFKATPGNTKIILTWTDFPNTGSEVVSHYRLQHRSGGSWPSTASPTGYQTAPYGQESYTYSGLTNGQSYEFRIFVKASRGSDTERYSSPISMIAGIPTAPTLTVTPGDGAAHLSWSGSDDNGSAISAYKIQYKLTSDNSWKNHSRTETGTTETIPGLTNEQSHDFRVRAVNTHGNGLWSDSQSATPIGRPDAPTLTVTPSNTQVKLEWTAPNDNGSAITGYEVRYKLNSATDDPANWTDDSTEKTILYYVARSLTNGTSYDFQVRAVNGIGAGEWAKATSTPVAGSIPDPPKAFKLTPQDTCVTLSWGAPSHIGSSSIKHYKVEHREEGTGSWTESIIPTSLKLKAICNLTNDKTYEFKMYTVNSNDDVSNPTETLLAIPGEDGPPEPPTNIKAIPGHESVKLTWDPPVPSNIDGNLHGYSVRYILASESDKSDSNWSKKTGIDENDRETEVENLTNGVTYEFQMRASVSKLDDGVLRVQEGSWSSPSVTATPIDKPDAPTNLMAESDDTTVKLTWTAPSGTVTDYKIEYSTDKNNWSTFPDGVSTSPETTVTGLINGTEYHFRVSAINNTVAGDPAEVSSTPLARGVPGQPTNLIAERGDTTVKLTWTVPPSNPVITYYIVAQSPDDNDDDDDGNEHAYRISAPGADLTDNGDGTVSYTVTGLVNGREYTFNVTAENSINPGTVSSDVTATPATSPGIPTGLTATRGSDSQEVDLTWTAPTNTGGSTITDYDIQYSSDSGNSWNNFVYTETETTTTVDELTNGTAYIFQVRAVNDVGHGDWSSNSNPAIPATTPSAPTLTATRGNTEVDLSWTKPNDNGNDISGYTVRYKLTSADDLPANWTEVSISGENTLTRTIGSLTNGTSYDFQVKAMNDAGDSEWSTKVSATPATTPGIPTNLQITPGNTVMDLKWVAPTNTGGDDITDYLIQYRPNNGTWSTFPDGTSTSLKTTVTNLINGTSYDFRVYAVNTVGQGTTPATASGTVGTVPDPPTNLIVRSYFDKSVLLEWTDTPPANNGGFPVSSYTIIIKDSNNNELDRVYNASSPQLTPELTPGQEYKFEVLAVNSRGNSTPSNQISAIPFTQPDPPTNLTVTSVSSGVVTLSWNKPAYNGGAPLSTYTLTVTNTSDNTSQYIPISSNLTEYTVRNLENSVQYSFSLTSSNTRSSSGLASVSSNSELATPGLKPGPVSSIYLHEGNGDVTLLWGTPNYEGLTPIIDYRIQRFSGGVLISEHIVAAGGTNGLHVSAPNDFVLKYVIQARNSHGHGQSVSVEGSPWERHPPGEITNLTATPGNNTIELSWSLPNSDPPILHLDLYLWCPGYAHLKYHQLPANSTSYTLHNLESGKTCTISILAYNRDAPGPSTRIQSAPLPDTQEEQTDSEQVESQQEQSNSEQIESQQTPTLDAPTIPAAPTNLVATLDDDQVELSWNAPSDNGGSPILDYIVEYRSSSTWIKWNDGTGTSTSTTINNLSDGTYSFRVFAVNSVGSSIDYSITSATIQTTESPVSEPTNLLATPGNGQVTLTWDVPDTSIVQYSDDGINWITFDDSAEDTTSVITGLTNNTQYYFKVSDDITTTIPSDIFTSDNRIGLILDDYTIYPTLEEFDNLPFVPVVYHGDSINGTKTLHNAGIGIIIGPSGFDSTYINQNDIIYISYNSTSPEFALKDNIFRFAPSDDNLGIIFAKLLQNDQIDNAIILHRDDTWGELMEQSLHLDSISYSVKSPNYDSIIEQLQSKQPDAIILFGFEETTEIVKTISNDIDTKWYLSHFDDSLTNVNYTIPVPQTIDISDILLILGTTLEMDTPFVESLYISAKNNATLNEYGDLGFIKYDIYKMNNGNLINTTLGISNIPNTLNVVAFIDSDNDKIYDKDEILLDDITITITDNEGNEYTKQTNSFGRATFEDITSPYTISGHYNSEAISIPATTTLYDIYLAFN